MTDKNMSVILQRAGVPTNDHLVFTEESLRENDGKTVPLTLKPGGPVVGEVTMEYVEEDKLLMGHYRIDDPDVAEFLQGPPPSIFGTGGL